MNIPLWALLGFKFHSLNFFSLFLSFPKITDAEFCRAARWIPEGMAAAICSPRGRVGGPGAGLGLLGFLEGSVKSEH